jgi:SAM-dependent methyltransferase
MTIPQRGNRGGPAHKRQTLARRRWWSQDYLHTRSLFRTLWQARGFVRGRVLDVGCGHQVYREWFEAEQYVGSDITLEDSSPDILAASARLPFAANTFDAVLCTQVLEHVPNPFETMAEIARLLKPSGYIVLTAPQAWRLHEIPHDYFRYTRFGLAHLAQSNGLRVIQIQPQGKAWAHLGQTFLNLLPTYLYKPALPLIVLVNLVCGALDTLWWEAGDTLNNLVVAQKVTPEEHGGDRFR